MREESISRLGRWLWALAGSPPAILQPAKHRPSAMTGRRRPSNPPNKTKPSHQIFEELSALLGPPIEIRMATPLSTHSTLSSSAAPASYSSMAAAGGAAVGAAAAAALVGSGGAGVSVAAFHVLFEQQPLLVFFEVLPKFPEEQPAITLQSVRWVLRGVGLWGAGAAVCCYRRSVHFLPPTHPSIHPSKPTGAPEPRAPSRTGATPGRPGGASRRWRRECSTL